MKVKFIEDWKKSWKFASVQWSTVGFCLMSFADSINAAVAAMPKHLQENIPHVETVATVVFGLVVLGRILKFDAKETENVPK